MALDVKDYLELLQNIIRKGSKNTVRTLNVCSLSIADMLLICRLTPASHYIQSFHPKVAILMVDLELAQSEI